MDATPDHREARARVESAESIVVFTGAGISAESGIPTYRGEGGVWRQYRAEDLATMDAFRRDPDLVWEWYGERRQAMAECDPGPGHGALAALERRVGDGFLLVTQNIDNLHRRAGSERILEIHGNAFRTVCSGCGRGPGGYETSVPSTTTCVHCGDRLRPDVVWFGEPLDPTVIGAAFQAAAECQVLLCVGSSLLVQPAASLPEIAIEAGADIIEVNPEPTWLTARARWSFQEPAGRALPLIAG